ncbi:hypothetical protein [Aquimarina algiphila]|uniref:hypothetical protein n=1 Tax=Aquimarina algiphila TaxID=2047982 RepID=UPI00232FFF87|nr:hypothetical protein [Aquimarina algiphila]
MKKVLFLLIFSVFSCKPHKQSGVSIDVQKNVDFSKSVKGLVYKIDSISNYYLVYLQHEKASYKVISEKINCTNRIKIDSSYIFKLKPLTDINYTNDSNKLTNIANYLDLERCVKYNGGVKICNEPGIELYSASNLHGLCFF